ncbi:MAG: DUF2256 domain-containing protein [Caulobacter vibrioides]|uniref:DUF2256 domain-containing protein n=1 Tax=Caulobacter vibrioides TaxID=155892 RepID=A0A258D3R2_CAUVI|nr:MAG: DUF2256 domain-containing protein [Caulobacter vibrioides]
MKAAKRPKATTPDKICESCGRPFSWRRKWARDWDQVKTCSDRCKGALRSGRAVTDP